MTKICKYNLALILGFCFFPSWGQSGVNQVVTETFINSTNKVISAEYFDGIGRPQVSIIRSDLPTSPSIATLTEYENNGRDTIIWVPIAVPSDEGTNVSAIKSNALTFYSDHYPFSTITHDNPFVDQLSVTIGPGQQWHQEGKALHRKTFVNSNGKYNCIKLGLIASNNNSIVAMGYYPSGILNVESITDEDGHEAISFKNIYGQLLLSRQVIAENNYADTYYIYNSAGNLTYVLPPKASTNFTPNGGEWAPSDDCVMKYAFCYHYDDKNRCIEKKLPGCSSVYYVYDKFGNLILSQDGNQRRKNRWSFRILDQFGRIASTGEMTDNRTVDQIRNAMKYASPRASINRISWTDDVNILTGITADDIKESFFYDNYSFLNTLSDSLKYVEANGYDTKYTNPSNANQINGKMTGKMVRVLDADNNPLIQSFFYDHHGNVIQQHQQNHLGGYDHFYHRLSFTGKPLEVKHIHTTTDTINEDITRYTYDAMERLLNISLSHDGGNEVTLSSNTYDAVGRLASCAVNDGGSNINYAYNVRGWTQQISASDGANVLFEQTLHYQDAPVGGIPCFNGNISGIVWRQRESLKAASPTENLYCFTYDAMNRLTKADYSAQGEQWNGDLLTMNDRNFSCTYTYDLNCNMVGLKRYGINFYNTALPTHIRAYGLIDDLAMILNGNQLLSVTDKAEDPMYAGAMDFKDGADKAEEYTYDANGNMTCDRNKGIHSITYNMLNQPRLILFNDGHEILYTYAADGRKLRTEYRLNNFAIIDDEAEPAEPAEPATFSLPGVGGIIDDPIELEPTYTTLTTRDYCGNYIYCNGLLERVLNDVGYVDSTGFHYQVKDYRGDIRAVVNKDNTLEEINSYYPYGMLHGTNATASVQPYKYTGKELNCENGLDWYDFGGRFYDPSINSTSSIDRECEQFYSQSPYSWSKNNPILNIDPSGNVVETVWDVANVLWDAGAATYHYIKGDNESVQNDLTDLALDVTAMIVPGLPAGVSKIISGSAKIEKIAANANRMKNIERGVPATQLGPSGKPKVHVVEKPNRKRAKEAARHQNGSNTQPIQHRNDKGQRPHYHPTRDGKKREGKNNVHYVDKSDKNKQDGT